MNRKIIFAAAALAAVVTLGTVAGNTVYAADSVSITNVSYDPTRELYEQYNKIFQKHWKSVAPSTSAASTMDWSTLPSAETYSTMG